MSGYLKCDAPGCDHVENVDAIRPEMIGRPCPKCGANLLTEEDCANWLANVQPGIDLMKAFGLLTDTTGKAGPDGGAGLVRVHLHDDTLTVTHKAAPTPEKSAP